MSGSPIICSSWKTPVSTADTQVNRTQASETPSTRPAIPLVPVSDPASPTCWGTLLQYKMRGKRKISTPSIKYCRPKKQAKSGYTKRQWQGEADRPTLWVRTIVQPEASQTSGDDHCNAFRSDRAPLPRPSSNLCGRMPLLPAVANRPPARLCKQSTQWM